jgi:hypothetical protein
MAQGSFKHEKAQQENPGRQECGPKGSMTSFRRVKLGVAALAGGQKQEYRLVCEAAGSLSRGDIYHKPLKLQSVLGATDTTFYCYRAQATAFKRATDAMRLPGTTVSLHGYHARWSLNGRVTFAAQL